MIHSTIGKLLHGLRDLSMFDDVYIEAEKTDGFPPCVSVTLKTRDTLEGNIRAGLLDLGWQIASEKDDEILEQWYFITDNVGFNEEHGRKPVEV